MSDVIAFLGPSLPNARVRGIDIRPPARQGDVWRALEARPRAIALIDGVFEHVPSVWHHELRAALASGVALFGAASMGALRAAELHTLGMIGVGQVFRWYRDGVVSDDGAVALLHADAEHGFKPLTVPLVNVMYVAEQLRAPKLLKAARAIHYQRRTWPAVFGRAGGKPPGFIAHDLKALDARECLDAALAFAQSGAPRGPVSELNVSSFVRRRRILDVGAPKPDERLADEGTRTALLAAWAKSQGLQPEPEAVERWQRQLRTVNDPAERLRLARIFALEERVLAEPERMLPDGPSRLEGLQIGALRRSGR